MSRNEFRLIKLKYMAHFLDFLSYICMAVELK